MNRQHTPLQLPRCRRTGQAGFTLVELMVAVTGGLFVSIMLFVLARDGARFYQREARVSDATLAAMIGFERLRTDIARASFLVSPNLQTDSQHCGADPPPQRARLVNLAGIRIAPGFSNIQILQANGLLPDALDLAGSYGSVEEFAVWGVRDDGGAGFTVFLQKDIGPAARLGIPTMANADIQELLEAIFQPDRGIRLVDHRGRSQYGTIVGVAVSAGEPSITLTADSNIQVRATQQSECGWAEDSTGTANVVNFIHYELRNLEDNDRYAPIYAEPDPRGWDADRTELVREEWGTDGEPITVDGRRVTQEIVAEYAVNLQFGVSMVTTGPNGDPNSLQTFLPGNPNIAAQTGNPQNGGGSPQDARVVRARLSVRSREADRRAQVLVGQQHGVPPGLYRIALGPGATAPFARVRTLQADVALQNQMGM